MKNSTKLKYDIIFEKIMERIPNSIKSEIKLKAVRQYMSESSFLLEAEKKFPVKSPGDVEYNPKLVYAAYIKAISEKDSHPEYIQIAESAVKIFKEINGHIKINFKIDESFAENDRDILNSIYLLEGKYDKIDHSENEFEEELPTDTKDMVDGLNHCVCSECGYEDILDMDDDALCEEKICPKCQKKSMIHAEIFESENLQTKLHNTHDIKDKMKLVVESTLKENIQSSGYHICKKCKIIIKDFINEQNDWSCPACGEKTNNVDKKHKLFSESNMYCPKCLTIKEFGILEEECPVCSSSMVKNKIKPYKSNNDAIPISD